MIKKTVQRGCQRLAGMPGTTIHTKKKVNIAKKTTFTFVASFFLIALKIEHKKSGIKKNTHPLDHMPKNTPNKTYKIIIRPVKAQSIISTTLMNLSFSSKGFLVFTQLPSLS